MALRIEDDDKAKLEELQGKMVGDAAGGLGMTSGGLGSRLGEAVDWEAKS